jgi:hypothetical protein
MVAIVEVWRHSGSPDSHAGKLRDAANPAAADERYAGGGEHVGKIIRELSQLFASGERFPLTRTGSSRQ